MLAGTVRKIKDCLLALALIILLILMFFGEPPSGSSVNKIFTLTMRVIFENREMQKIWNLTEGDRAIGLFVNNSWQESYLVKASHSIEKFDVDSDGNKIAVLNLTRRFIGPGERMGYNVTYILVFKERKLPSILEDISGEIDEIPEDLRKEYCQPTALWQSNISILREKALEIAGSEKRVLTILKKFVVWIANKIRYGSSELPRYPLETFSSGEGDCDDQANLLITFCRAVGIPAYLQIGCIYIPNWSRSRSYYTGRLIFNQVRVGWHGWAMVFVPPWGWLPVDLTYVEADLKVEPLKSITFSAVLKHYTFQYMNITKTDYVAETRLLKSFLESHEFYIYEEDNMKEMSRNLPTIIILKTHLLTLTRLVKESN